MSRTNHATALGSGVPGVQIAWHRAFRGTTDLPAAVARADLAALSRRER